MKNYREIRGKNYRTDCNHGARKHSGAFYSSVLENFPVTVTVEINGFAIMCIIKLLFKHVLFFVP